MSLCIENIKFGSTCINQCKTCESLDKGETESENVSSMRLQEKRIEMLKKELEFANNEANFWRLRAEQENEAYTDLHFIYRIMTAPDGERRAVQKEYIDYLDMVKEKRESQPILIVSDSKAVNKVNSDDLL